VPEKKSGMINVVKKEAEKKGEEKHIQISQRQAKHHQ